MKNLKKLKEFNFEFNDLEKDLDIEKIQDGLWIRTGQFVNELNLFKGLVNVNGLYVIVENLLQTNGTGCYSEGNIKYLKEKVFGVSNVKLHEQIKANMKSMLWNDKVFEWFVDEQYIEKLLISEAGVEVIGEEVSERFVYWISVLMTGMVEDILRGKNIYSVESSATIRVLSMLQNIDEIYPIKIYRRNSFLELLVRLSSIKKRNEGLGKQIDELWNKCSFGIVDFIENYPYSNKLDITMTVYKRAGYEFLKNDEKLRFLDLIEEILSKELKKLEGKKAKSNEMLKTTRIVELIEDVESIYSNFGHIRGVE